MTIQGQSSAVTGMVAEDSIYFGEAFHYQIRIDKNQLPNEAEVVLDLNKIVNLSYSQDSTLFDQYGDLQIDISNSLSPFLQDKVVRIPISKLPTSISESMRIFALSIGAFYFPDPTIIANGDTLNPLVNGDILLVLPPEGVALDSLGMINDIKPIIEIPVSIWDYLGYIIGLLLVLLLFWYIWKKRQEKKKEEPMESPEVTLSVPAHELALKRLNMLKQEKPWQQNLIKEYQSELTHIIREYLENRYDINALESTTSDILDKLKGFQLSNEQRVSLTEVLTVADLVKFAKANPEGDIHERFLELAISFVQSTKYGSHAG